MARSSAGLALLLCVALLVAAASAAQFRVGGQRGWSVPDANAEPYNSWAGRMRFQIGDQLLFAYPKDTDSVLLVDPAAYNACNTSSYVNRFDDGNTVFTLDRSGPFFFISGNDANCRANEKLIVVVLADRSGTRTPPTMSPPAAQPTMSPPAAQPTMPPPSSAPLPSPSSSPPASAPVPSPASSTPTPTSAPSPAGSAPATSPPSPSPPAAVAPSPSSTPGTAPPPPSGEATAPAGEGGSATTPPSPPSGNGQSGASTAVAGFAATLGAYVGYAMLAI